MIEFSGSGPGVQTKDGCSVELYARLPYRGELSIPASYIKAGATVLELGCGAGRGTRALLDAGFLVTAVDNSPEMLACSPAGATSVLSDIETLALEERFDAVILPTGLINHADPTTREGLVACARRHLQPNGWFFIERQDPVWLESATAGSGGRSGDVDVCVESVSREDRTVSITLRYIVGEDSWLHSFQLFRFKNHELQKLLSASGFGSIEWLNEKKTWLKVEALARHSPS